MRYSDACAPSVVALQLLLLLLMSTMDVQRMAVFGQSVLRRCVPAAAVCGERCLAWRIAAFEVQQCLDAMVLLMLMLMLILMLMLMLDEQKWGGKLLLTMAWTGKRRRRRRMEGDKQQHPDDNYES